MRQIKQEIKEDQNPFSPQINRVSNKLAINARQTVALDSNQDLTYQTTADRDNQTLSNQKHRRSRSTRYKELYQEAAVLKDKKEKRIKANEEEKLKKDMEDCRSTAKKDTLSAYKGD